MMCPLAMHLSSVFLLFFLTYHHYFFIHKIALFHLFAVSYFDQLFSQISLLQY